MAAAGPELFVLHRPTQHQQVGVQAVADVLHQGIPHQGAQRPREQGHRGAGCGGHPGPVPPDERGDIGGVAQEQANGAGFKEQSARQQLAGGLDHEISWADRQGLQSLQGC